MNRTTFVIIGILLTLFMGTILYFLFRTGPAKEDAELVTPGSLVAARPSADAIQLPADQGTVVMDNFFKKSSTVNEGYDQYELGSDLNEAIRYDAVTNTFTLSINPATVAEFEVQRVAIERRFLQLLNISENEACRLTVIIATAPAPDEPVSSKQFSLSFCN